MVGGIYMTYMAEWTPRGRRRHYGEEKEEEDRLTQILGALVIRLT